MHFEYLLFIPPDHNIHFQVSWCTGAGQSVSATRRWSDYSCLNSKLGGRYGLHTSTYANTHMLAHVSVHKSFRRNKWRISLIISLLPESSQLETQADSPVCLAAATVCNAYLFTGSPVSLWESSLSSLFNISLSFCFFLSLLFLPSLSSPCQSFLYH